jgi:hypothetical protein
MNTFSSKEDKVRTGGLGYFITNAFLLARMVKYWRLCCVCDAARMECQGMHM